MQNQPTITQNRKILPSSSVLHQVLPLVGLMLGLMLTAIWISVLGYQIIGLLEPL
jgi:hypothetical protein